MDKHIDRSLEKEESLSEQFAENSIFEDISSRTGGNIYISAVGPVRTGKSTFIKKFMDLVVLPRITDEYDRARTTDALPQSGAGKTIMTTELKFVPDDAILIEISDGVKAKVRLVDCEGYAIEGALGFMESNGPRMVRTPWYDHPIPFEEAAEIGTKKVITDHSTMGILVTTDGSITDLPREAYVAAEQRVVAELTELNKPFIVVLNSRQPEDVATLTLANELEEAYQVPVLPTNVAGLDEDGIMRILEEILFEFPVSEVNIGLPQWIEDLDCDHWLRAKFEDAIVNDMNTSMGITVIYDMLKADINDATKLALIESFDYVLSLDLLKAAAAVADGADNSGEAVKVDAELEAYILAMIEERKAAKKEKNFARADEIRNELLEKGIALEDTREGVKWKMV